MPLKLGIDVGGIGVRALGLQRKKDVVHLCRTTVGLRRERGKDRTGCDGRTVQLRRHQAKAPTNLMTVSRDAIWMPRLVHRPVLGGNGSNSRIWR